MNISDHLRLRDREKVAVVQKILFRVLEPPPANVGFSHAIGADRGAHRTIYNGYAMLEDPEDGMFSNIHRISAKSATSMISNGHSYPRRKPFPTAGAVTGIGSLPFRQTAKALECVAEYSPEIPFWPQLPQLSAGESAIAQGFSLIADLIEPRGDGYGYQVKAGRLDVVVERLSQSDGELTAASAAGFYAFEEALLLGRFSSASAIKGQVEGPITLAACLFQQNRSFLSDAALFAAVSTHVSCLIRRQVERLSVADLPVVLFVDEPVLCLAPTSPSDVTEAVRLDAVAAAMDTVREAGAYAGLHCCAERPFAQMCRAKPDILSFDAHEGLELFFADQDARNFAVEGGTVAYGMIPTWQGVAGLDSVSLFTRWFKAASEAGNAQELAQHALITATCGLGLLDETSVPASIDLARRLGMLIHSLAVNA